MQGVRSGELDPLFINRAVVAAPKPTSAAKPTSRAAKSKAKAKAKGKKNKGAAEADDDDDDDEEEAAAGAASFSFGGLSITQLKSWCARHHATTPARAFSRACPRPVDTTSAVSLCVSPAGARAAPPPQPAR